MHDTPRIRGVLSPVVTTFRAPDPRFMRQRRWLRSQSVALAVFGTNSEACSLSVQRRPLDRRSLERRSCR